MAPEPLGADGGQRRRADATAEPVDEHDFENQVDGRGAHG